MPTYVESEGLPPSKKGFFFAPRTHCITQEWKTKKGFARRGCNGGLDALIDEWRTLEEQYRDNRREMPEEDGVQRLVAEANQSQRGDGPSEAKPAQSHMLSRAPHPHAVIAVARVLAGQPTHKESKEVLMAMAKYMEQHDKQATLELVRHFSTQDALFERDTVNTSKETKLTLCINTLAADFRRANSSGPSQAPPVPGLNAEVYESTPGAARSMLLAF